MARISRCRVTIKEVAPVRRISPKHFHMWTPTLKTLTAPHARPIKPMSISGSLPPTQQVPYSTTTILYTAGATGGGNVMI